MEAKLFRLRLALRNPFRIAHGSYSFRENIFIWLGEGGCAGMGEAPIVPYYGISADEVEADLRRGLTRRSLEEALAGRAPGTADFAYAVSRSAFQSAVLSLRSALGGGSVQGILGVSGAEASSPCPASSFTVAYDDDIEAMARIAASCGFRRLKVKAGIAGDVERVALIRERLPGAIIRVDANQGWLLEEAPAKIAALERLGVELIEEPTVGSPSELEALASATGVPILLDESARDIEQVRRYAKEAPSVAGIVVKTAKNGGPAASLELARAARESGMEVMVSCMVETSLGVGAALGLAPLCAWCDLDAPLLIAEDPFTGLSYEGEVPMLSAAGVAPGPGLAARIAGLESLDLGGLMVEIAIRDMLREDAPACAAIACASAIGERYGFRPDSFAASLVAALDAGGELFVAEATGSAEEGGARGPAEAGEATGSAEEGAGTGEAHGHGGTGVGAPAEARILGFAWIDPRGAFSSAPYLRLIAVDESARGTKLGSSLLAEFEARTAPVGRDWCLLVSDFNLRAQSFYARHGYKKAGELPDFARPGITEILMVKKRGPGAA